MAKNELLFQPKPEQIEGLLKNREKIKARITAIEVGGKEQYPGELEQCLVVLEDINRNLFYNDIETQKYYARLVEILKFDLEIYQAQLEEIQFVQQVYKAYCKCEPKYDPIEQAEIRDFIINFVKRLKDFVIREDSKKLDEIVSQVAGQEVSIPFTYALTNAIKELERVIERQNDILNKYKKILNTNSTSIV